MIPVLDSRGMRAADARAIRGGIASEDLMENAAMALCRELTGFRRIVAVCGPGNNGGDGLAAARLLALAGASVRVFTLHDPSAYTGDPAIQLTRARGVGLAPVSLSGAGGFVRLRRALAESEAVVDALFGTGLCRTLGGEALRAVAAMNACRKPILAADLPSGLSVDGGALLGPAVRAAKTVALGAPKLCHVLPPASDFCGVVVVADIGISREALETGRERLFVAEASDVRALLPPRRSSSHKAEFGRLAVVAGSRGKAGAAILAARGALRGGAGLVTVFCPESLEALVVGSLPEAMTRALPESGGGIAESAARELVRSLRSFDAVVIGPGLGEAQGTVRVLETLLRDSRVPIVADADALNAFRGRPGAFARRRSATILTPHPGEAGRLLGLSSGAVQSDRLRAARRLARASGAIVLLKGANSLIVRPRGEVVVNPTGTPLLATAGSGDVLAGLIGALFAGGLDAGDAAMAGAWLHGAAAQTLSLALGDAGLLAHEVADAVPRARRALTAAPVPPDA